MKRFLILPLLLLSGTALFAQANSTPASDAAELKRQLVVAQQQAQNALAESVAAKEELLSTAKKLTETAEAVKVLHAKVRELQSSDAQATIKAQQEELGQLTTRVGQLLLQGQEKDKSLNALRTEVAALKEQQKGITALETRALAAESAVLELKTKLTAHEEALSATSKQLSEQAPKMELLAKLQKENQELIAQNTTLLNERTEVQRKAQALVVEAKAAQEAVRANPAPAVVTNEPKVTERKGKAQSRTNASFYDSLISSVSP